MPIPLKWVSPLIISGGDYNNARLYRPYDYIISVESSYYYAYGQYSGSTDYSGSDASTVIQAAIDILTSGGTLFFKCGVYLINTKLTTGTISYLTFIGEGWGSELRANASIGSVLNISSGSVATVKDLQINGYGLANKGIDAMHTDCVPMHVINNCRVCGATGSCIDFTGCEDSTIIGGYVDGRLQNSGTTLYADYGLKIGESGSNAYVTQGQISVINLQSGFCKKADVFLRGIWDPKFIACTFTSKYEWAPTTFEAIIIVEGATVGSAPMVKFTDCWLDGATNTKPAILCRNNNVRSIESTNSHINATSGSCISGSIDIGSITIWGGIMEQSKTGTIAPLICGSTIGQLTILETEIWSNTYPDFSHITRYFVHPYASGSMAIKDELRVIGNSVFLDNNQAYYIKDFSGVSKTAIKMDISDTWEFGDAGRDIQVMLWNHNLYLYTGSLLLDNAQTIRWKDSTGTNRDVISLASDNTFYLYNPGGFGHIEMQPYVAGGRVKMYNVPTAMWLGEFDASWTRLVNSGSDPNTGSWANTSDYVGRFWYNTTAKQFRYYDGANIIPISTGSKIT